MACVQVRVLLSWASDSPPGHTVASWDNGIPSVDMTPLTTSERRDIVTQQLAYYRKKLTVPQMDLLLSKAESGKPLFLITSCEELRLQAQYGLGGTGVNDFIRWVAGGTGRYPAATADLRWCALAASTGTCRTTRLTSSM